MVLISRSSSTDTKDEQDDNDNVIANGKTRITRMSQSMKTKLNDG
jgi:hypothetical protein